MLSINNSTSNLLGEMADEELLLLRANLDAEMRTRKIAFSVGEVGEVLTIEYFKTTPGLPKLQKAPTGTKNVDALSRNGDRYSIKTICRGKKTGTVYPDSENPDKQLFEYLLIARLDDYWKLISIHQVSWGVFLKIRSWDKRMNAWYIAISGRTLSAATKVMSLTSPND